MKWNEITGWINYGDVYERAVERFPGGTLVEVGTFLGQSLAFLADTAIKSGKTFRICGVDTCLGSGVEHGVDHSAPHLVRGTFAGSLHANLINCGFGDVVDLLVCSSSRASTYFADDSVEFVFIDALHTYDGVRADIDLWLPKVKHGGWLCGHDYEPGVWDGVVAAVQDRLPGFERISLSSWRYEKR